MRLEKKRRGKIDKRRKKSELERVTDRRELRARDSRVHSVVREVLFASGEGKGRGRGKVDLGELGLEKGLELFGVDGELLDTLVEFVPRHLILEEVRVTRRQPETLQAGRNRTEVKKLT
jgi:hypothetical protein